MSKPDVQSGFLGGQPKFGEIGLSLDSHQSAEFNVKGTNNVAIKLNTKKPIKTTTKLLLCASGVPDEEISGNVLTQRKEGKVEYNVVFPKNGWYKLMIFALPESDAGDSLPGVYNYLIEVTSNHKTAYPYAKVYTKFYADYCYLDEPKYLKKGNSSSLKNVKFELKVPGAKKVAVHAGEEWFQLTKKGDEWEANCDLSKYSGKDTKVTVNGNYDDAGTSYSVLLDYII